MNLANETMVNKTDQYLKDLALRMTVHCIRNTIIENYHAQGKISDPEMGAFTKEVGNNIYTLLHLLFNPKYRKEGDILLGSETLFHRPIGWDEPIFIKKWMEAVQNNE